MLNLSRRHSATKCGKTKKRDCTCPIWVTGSLNGKPVRKTLGVRNWSSAQKIVRDWEANPEGSEFRLKRRLSGSWPMVRRGTGRGADGEIPALGARNGLSVRDTAGNGVSVDDLSE